MVHAHMRLRSAGINAEGRHARCVLVRRVKRWHCFEQCEYKVAHLACLSGTSLSLRQLEGGLLSGALRPPLAFACFSNEIITLRSLHSTSARCHLLFSSNPGLEKLCARGQHMAAPALKECVQMKQGDKQWLQTDRRSLASGQHSKQT
jgi:hypothetical protein